MVPGKNHVAVRLHNNLNLISLLALFNYLLNNSVNSFNSDSLCLDCFCTNVVYQDNTELCNFFVTDLFGLTEVLSTAFSCTAHWLGFDLFEPCFVSDTSFSFFDKGGLLFLSSFGRLAEGSTNVDFLFWAAISVKKQATQLWDSAKYHNFLFLYIHFPFTARSCCDQKVNH